MRRRRRVVRLGARVGRIVLWSGLGLAAGLLAAVGLPPLAGYRSLTVMSGSMQPAVSTGDVVVNELIPPLAARAGDVISFRDPDDRDRMITHRLRRVTAIGSTVEMETKGDANNSVERWTMPSTGRVGRVIYRVPRLGFLLHWAGSPKGRLLLIALPTLALGALALFALWRPSRTRAALEAFNPALAVALSCSISGGYGLCGGQGFSSLRVVPHHPRNDSSSLRNFP